MDTLSAQGQRQPICRCRDGPPTVPVGAAPRCSVSVRHCPVSVCKRHSLHRTRNAFDRRLSPVEQPGPSRHGPVPRTLVLGRNIRVLESGLRHGLTDHAAVHGVRRGPHPAEHHGVRHHAQARGSGEERFRAGSVDDAGAGAAVFGSKGLPVAPAGGSPGRCAATAAALSAGRTCPVRLSGDSRSCHARPPSLQHRARVPVRLPSTRRP